MFGIGGPELAILMLSCAVLGVYLLPTIVAGVRKKKNLPKIVLVNVLLGWSVIGWIVAMVWAVSSEPEITTPGRPGSQIIGTLCSHCGKYTQPESRFCANCGTQFAPN
ncbi:MAG TPA: superinfection immunity protein [Candidatus Eisenbacteria bacterium]|jgi:hypothetical protein